MKTQAPFDKGGLVPVCPFRVEDCLSVFYDAGANVWHGVERADLYAGPPSATVLADPAKTITSVFSGNKTVASKAVGMVVSESLPSGVSPCTVRILDAGADWADIETSKGVYSTTALAKLDSLINGASASGCDVVFVMARTPSWAAVGGDVHNVPSDFSNLTSFVNYLYGRYGNKITHYEGWNEPNVSGSFNGSISDLVNHQKALYSAVKAKSSALGVITPAFTFIRGITDTLGLNAYLTAAYASSSSSGYYGDIIGYHFYSESAFLRFNRTCVDAVLTAIAAHPGTSALPVWCTEVGNSKATSYALNEAVAYCVAKGVSRLIWYSWDNPGRGDMRLSNIGVSEFNRVANMWHGKTLTSLNTVSQPVMDGTVYAGGAELGAVIDGVGVLID